MRPVCASVADQLLREAALADPGLTAQQEKPALPAGRVVERAGQF